MKSKEFEINDVLLESCIRRSKCRYCRIQVIERQILTQQHLIHDWLYKGKYNIYIVVS